MQNEKELLKLGTCGKPHGIKGAFSFQLFSGEQSILRKGFVFKAFPASSSSSIDQEGCEYRIESISFGNKAIVYLEDISSRTEVEQMVPFDIFARREDFPSAEDGEYYLNDLIGLEVRDSESKKVIGVIKSLGDNGIQDILLIKQVDKSEYLEVPLVDSLVPTIDIEQGFVEVIPLELV